MKREIEFRAWHKVEERWVNQSEHLNETEVSATHNAPSILALRHRYWDIMQYTNLKDKNGTKIFEGDIVEFRHKEMGHIITCKVGFANGGFIREFEGMGSIGNTPLQCPPIQYTLDYEVIGNIPQNPELIK